MAGQIAVDGVNQWNILIQMGLHLAAIKLRETAGNQINELPGFRYITALVLIRVPSWSKNT